MVREMEVLPPVFVLGHWRSGTTHLHNLLAVDGRFAFPNNYRRCSPALLTMEAARIRRSSSGSCPPPSDGQHRVDDAVAAGGRVRPVRDDVHVAVYGVALPEAACPLRPLPYVPRRR